MAGNEHTYKGLSCLAAAKHVAAPRSPQSMSFIHGSMSLLRVSTAQQQHWYKAATGMSTLLITTTTPSSRTFKHIILAGCVRQHVIKCELKGLPGGLLDDQAAGAQEVQA